MGLLVRMLAASLSVAVFAAPGMAEAAPPPSSEARRDEGARLPSEARPVEAAAPERERTQQPAEPASPTPEAHAPELETARALDVSLLAGGSMAVVVGVVLTTLAARSAGFIDRTPRDALRLYDASSVVPPVNGDERRIRGQAMLGSGIVLVSLGVGAIIWGTVRMVTNRPSRGRNARIVPGAGLLAVRF